MSSNGQWQAVITTPDGTESCIDILPGKLIEFGRSEAILPPARINHKYVSRCHFTLKLTLATIGVPSFVVVQQSGKNPTLYSEASTKISPGASMTISQAEADKAGEHFSHQNTVGATSLHFPGELKLPMIHVLHHSRSSSVKKEMATDNDSTLNDPRKEHPFERMLTVPVDLASDNEDEKDDDEAPPPARQLRLLDEALRQQIAANSAQLSTHALDKAWSPPPPSTNTPVASVTRANHPPSAEQKAKEQHRMLIDDEDKPLFPLPVVRKPSTNTIAPLVSPSLLTTAASPPKTHPVVATTTTPPSHGSMGFWEWKCHAEGNDDDPKNWKRYTKAQADVIEAAYRKDGGKTTIVSIDDTYNVCFNDVHVGMAQYRKDDPSRWRSVRRRGGDKVDRSKAKKVAIIKDTGMSSSSSSSDSGDDSSSSRPSWIVSDSSDDDYTDSDDSSASFDTESSIETQSSDSDKKKKKKHHKANKKKANKKPPKRAREDD